MPVVTRISAKQPAAKAFLNVAAYARVSEETDRLHHSLAAQVGYYSKQATYHPEWTFLGVYADEGLTGTNTNRPEFMRLITDCDAGKIDLVLTKSISRFARNTVDLLSTIRHLKELGVEVFFEKENIHTMSGDGELLLTLLASFAQSESMSISDNVKWGQRKRFERGIPNGHFNVYGYRWYDNELVAVAEEAAVVKLIFNLASQDTPTPQIARELKSRGILNRNGMPFSESTIAYMLKNELYTGILTLQRVLKTSPINGRRIKNDGQLPKYVIEDDHEAFVDAKTFSAVQELQTRRLHFGSRKPATCFSGKLICGICGKVFYRKTANSGKKHWACASMHTAVDKCGNRRMLESDLLTFVSKALHTDTFSEEAFSEQVASITVLPDVLAFRMNTGNTAIFRG